MGKVKVSEGSIVLVRYLGKIVAGRIVEIRPSTRRMLIDIGNDILVWKNAGEVRAKSTEDRVEPEIKVIG